MANITNSILNEKYKALKNYLIDTEAATADELPKDVNEVYNENWETFEVIGNEYKVLTDEQADKEAADYIKESLWAFNTDFIWQHTKSYQNTTAQEDKVITKAIRVMQEELCETANEIVKVLISDIDTFIEDAIEADGRGHFISTWDGQEYESGDFYIYRTN